MVLEQARLITASILLGFLAVFTCYLAHIHSQQIFLPPNWRPCRLAFTRACYELLVLIVVLFLTYSSLVLEQCVQKNEDFPSFDDFWGWLFLVLFIRLVTMILEQPIWNFGVYMLLTCAATYLHLQVSFALKVRIRFNNLGIMEDPVLDEFNYFRGVGRIVSLEDSTLSVHWVTTNETTAQCFSDIPITCPNADIHIRGTNQTCADIQEAILEAPEWPFSGSDDTSRVPWTTIFGYWPTCDARYIETDVIRYWDAYAYTSAYQSRLLFYLLMTVLVAMGMVMLWCRKRKRLMAVGAVTGDHGAAAPRQQELVPQPARRHDRQPEGQPQEQEVPNLQEQRQQQVELQPPSIPAVPAEEEAQERVQEPREDAAQEVQPVELQQLPKTAEETAEERVKDPQEKDAQEDNSDVELGEARTQPNADDARETP